MCYLGVVRMKEREYKKDPKRHGLRILKPYIKLINDKNIRSFTFDALHKAPHYFWLIPASSTGKYHPKFSQGMGGLIKHVAFAMYIGDQLCTTFSIEGKNRDCVLSAIALHDINKKGFDLPKESEPDYQFFHPLLPREHLHELRSLYGKEDYDTIMFLVETHMGSAIGGKWTPGFRQPETLESLVVHLADYISSRKKIEFGKYCKGRNK